MATIKRPLIRYHGGKFRLAEWVISFFPYHKIYCEPYGGAASVLLKKERSDIEIYNDIDQEIVNIFRVLRNPDQGNELIRQLQLTPFSRIEFDNSYVPAADPVEQARRTIVRAFMGFSSDSATRRHKTGFRSTSINSYRYSAAEWPEHAPHLFQIIERLKGVTIECLPALEIIEKYDSPKTLFYLDPPYPRNTRHYRKGRDNYNHEMTDDQHKELLLTIKNISGMCIISGYQNELYDDLLSGWANVGKKSRTQAGNKKGTKIETERLWISPNARKLSFL